jgi:hypothetical protein
MASGDMLESSDYDGRETREERRASRAGSVQGGGGGVERSRHRRRASRSARQRHIRGPFARELPLTEAVSDSGVAARIRRLTSLRKCVPATARSSTRQPGYLPHR